MKLRNIDIIELNRLGIDIYDLFNIENGTDVDGLSSDILLSLYNNNDDAIKYLKDCSRYINDIDLDSVSTVAGLVNDALSSVEYSESDISEIGLLCDSLIDRNNELVAVIETLLLDIDIEKYIDINDPKYNNLFRRLKIKESLE